MKKFLVLSIILIIIVCPIAGCGEVKIFTDPEQPISVKVNREFIIATGTNPPTGYMWRENYDEAMFELVSSTVEVSEAVKKGEAEIGLEQHFRFKARGRGKTEIAILLVGPDTKFVKSKKTFTVNVE